MTNYYQHYYMTLQLLEVNDFFMFFLVQNSSWFVLGIRVVA